MALAHVEYSQPAKDKILQAHSMTTAAGDQHQINWSLPQLPFKLKQRKLLAISSICNIPPDVTSKISCFDFVQLVATSNVVNPVIVT